MNNNDTMLEFYKLSKTAFACVREEQIPLWGAGFDFHVVVCYDVIEIERGSLTICRASICACVRDHI
jgi:hypothetical protein